MLSVRLRVKREESS